MANATVGGRLLGPGELVPYYVLLATAGHDTVSTVLAGGVWSGLDRVEAVVVTAGEDQAALDRRGGEELRRAGRRA